MRTKLIRRYSFRGYHKNSLAVSSDGNNVDGVILDSRGYSLDAIDLQVTCTNVDDIEATIRALRCLQQQLIIK